MLSDIVLVILAIYACSTPLWVVKSIKFGLKIAENTEKAAEEPVFNIPSLPKKNDIELPEEVKADIAVLENIEAYDGTSHGQKEII